VAKGTRQRGAVTVVTAQIAGIAPPPASHVSPGEAQIARILGVDPAAHTRAELARMKWASDSVGDE
jgi:hypothetical protein